MVSPTALVISTATSKTNTPIPLSSTATFTPSPTTTPNPTPTPFGTIFSTIPTNPYPTSTPIPTVTPANKIATDRNRFGISLDMEYVDNATYSQIFELTNEIGINWVRFRFDSNLIEPEMNHFEWENYDTVVAKAKEENLQVLGVLGYTSLWNASITPGSGEGVNPFIGQYYPPASYEIWGNSVYQIVSHYKDDVHYWEIWNEPDTDTVSPYSRLWRGSPHEFAKLLATAYNAIKEADPEAKVLLGSLFTTRRGTVLYSNTAFFHEILTDETYPAANNFDIVGVHFSDYPENLSARINEVISTFASTNTDVHPIWITEISYPSYGYAYQQGVGRERYFCNIITTDMVATVAYPIVEKFFLFDKYQQFVTPGKCYFFE